MGMLFYLAEPIDQAVREDQAVDHAANVMSELGHSSYRPGEAFQVGGKPNAVVQGINEYALDSCDGLFAVLLEGDASLGVPAEIDRAVRSGKPVVLATDLGNSSWVVANWETSGNFRKVKLSGNAVAKGVSWLIDTAQELAEVQAKHRDNPRRRKRFTPHVEGPVVFERKSPYAQLPERAYDTDAGFDLFTSEETHLEPGKTTYVPCGVAVDVPDGYWAMVTGRSSTKFKLGLDVTQGVIDEGYNGELFAVVHNPTGVTHTVKEGDRLAQLVLLPAVGGTGAQWGTVREKPRGANGFGSSGQGAMVVNIDLKSERHPAASVPSSPSISPSLADEAKAFREELRRETATTSTDSEAHLPAKVKCDYCGGLARPGETLGHEWDCRSGGMM